MNYQRGLEESLSEDAAATLGSAGGTAFGEVEECKQRLYSRTRTQEAAWGFPWLG